MEIWNGDIQHLLYISMCGTNNMFCHIRTHLIHTWPILNWHKAPCFAIRSRSRPSNILVWRILYHIWKPSIRLYYSNNSWLLVSRRYLVWFGIISRKKYCHCWDNAFRCFLTPLLVCILELINLTYSSLCLYHLEVWNHRHLLFVGWESWYAFMTHAYATMWFQYLKIVKDYSWQSLVFSFWFNPEA